MKKGIKKCKTSLITTDIRLPFSVWGVMLEEEVKVWVCPKCGGKQFKLLLKQVVHDVYNRNGDSKPWSYTDATIDSEEVLMVECNSCGEVLERS